MKKFLRYILFFGTPIFAWFIIEGLLPITTFTFRHYEAIRFESKIPHNAIFYPNINSEMNAVGDLCHHTENAIIKKEIWISDKIGFRNNQFIEQADILFIGDSFTQGSSLSQDETISSKVEAKIDNSIKVYNMAPSSMSQFDRLMKLNVIKKPKLIIFSIVERNMPSEIQLFKLNDSNQKKSNIYALESAKINIFLDKALKQYSKQWILSRINDTKGKGIKGIGDSDMYFLRGINQEPRNKDIIKTKERLLAYKNYCDSLGVKFLFLPMPNKETVYYDLVPLKEQPDYLLKLDSLLVKSEIRTINTLELYNEYRKAHRSLLYHKDDTHWNSRATELVATEIIKQINNY